jgi:hypothetical protein
MSEYQYYEFQAIDKPLSSTDRAALREISTRAEITTTSMINRYHWGDFKGDTDKLMKSLFDLHLYLTNWGSRRLMIRLPKRHVDVRMLERASFALDCVEVHEIRSHVVLDIECHEMEYDYCDDGSGWLTALAPLRIELMGGDSRLLSLLWLIDVEFESISDEEAMPFPLRGPLTESLDALANFFMIDRDLIEAAIRLSGSAAPDSSSDPSTIGRFLDQMPESSKRDLLIRLFQGDVKLPLEAQALLRRELASKIPRPPTIHAGTLRTEADEIREARQREESRLKAEEKRRRAEKTAAAQRARLDAIKERGESVWEEVELKINRRVASGYDQASALLSDLAALAEQEGAETEFQLRLEMLRRRHHRKRLLLERLQGL